MIAYKYRGGPNFVRDLDSLANDCFYAAGLDTLNDAFEATYSTEPIEKLLELMELFAAGDSSLATVKESWQAMLKNVAKAGVFSLAARPDDLKLWAHYGSNYAGFCVGYEAEMLVKFNSYAYYAHYLVKVNYADQPATLEIDDLWGKDIHYILQKVLGMKHPEWEHEAETRIITDNVGLMPHDFRAVKSIHFGLHMPQAQMNEVMQRMQGRGIAYYKMERSPTAYGLKATPVADPFASAPRYLYRVVPVASYAMDTYVDGEEGVALLPYLHKAIEIQRRDPYCTEVTFADRCTSEERAGQVYVNYFYGLQYYNRYFTMEEVERLYAQITDITD